MKKNMKEQMVEFLKKAQEIILSDGETEFEEIRKKKRVEIVENFIKMFPDAETDGDSDGAFLSVKGKVCDLEYEIIFSACCDCPEDIPEHAGVMEVYISYKGECAEDIPKALELLERAISEETRTPLALLNTSILTCAGTYKLEDISLDAARKIVSDNTDNLDSAIGHQSTAEIMTTLIGVDVSVNRQMFSQDVGQQALVFKLNGRPQEGKILSASEIEEIGYKFQLLTRIS